MKIFFFTTVPSDQAKSWSNIPFFLHKNLEKKGYKVVNVVMGEPFILKFLYNMPTRFLNKFTNFDSLSFYNSSSFHFYLMSLKRYIYGLLAGPNDVFIVQGFSYPPKIGKHLNIIIGDWPSRYLFDEMKKKKPNLFEAMFIKREGRVINLSDHVITLFPHVQKYMSDNNMSSRVHFFGNVVNIEDDVELSQNEIEVKYNSNKILFIGQSAYLTGAVDLIKAVIELRKLNIKYEVDIVGISLSEIDFKFDWLRVHGYLDKQDERQKLKYNSLLTNAKYFINTTKVWAGFQSILEAMYYHTPVIVSANPGLSSFFKGEDPLIYLGEKALVDLLCQKEKEKFSDYLITCTNSKDAVKQHTWANFTSHLQRLFHA